MNVHVTQEELDVFINLVKKRDLFTVKWDEQIDATVLVFTKSGAKFILGAVIRAFIDALDKAQKDATG